MIELTIAVKVVEGTTRCEVGVFEKVPDEGTEKERAVASAIITGLQVVLTKMGEIEGSYKAMDLKDLHSQLAEAVRTTFFPKL